VFTPSAPRVDVQFVPSPGKAWPAIPERVSDAVEVAVNDPVAAPDR
jgi:hypothetical protein